MTWTQSGAKQVEREKNRSSWLASRSVYKLSPIQGPAPAVEQYSNSTLLDILLVGRVNSVARAMVAAQC
jgi:hypothetical protein